MPLIVKPDLYSGSVHKTLCSERNVSYLCSPVFWPLDTRDCGFPEIWLVYRKAEPQFK